jgi:hypothetical protein
MRETLLGVQRGLILLLMILCLMALVAGYSVYQNYRTNPPDHKPAIPNAG